MTTTDPAPNPEAAIARRAIPLLDLTDLSDACSATAIDALCAKARQHGVAAVCIWPHYVTQAGRGLSGSPVRLATVINFPAGGSDIERAVEDTVEALDDGAHEIDLVMPYRAFLNGETDTARGMVEAVREVCDERCLKVILETGTLETEARIAEASRLAIAAGADFLKTSTGKSSISATPEAAETMLRAIRDEGGGRSVGLKVSGGLRTASDASLYLDLADRIMGPDWATSKTFRLGASSLLSELVAAG